MNNSLIDIITGKERKRYNQIIQLIDQRNYSVLFDMDRDQSFGLSNQKYIDRVLDRIEQEVSNNPEFLIQMNQSYYHRANHFNEITIKSNPKIVESFIEQNIWGSDKLVSTALDNGYIPSSDYINSHLRSFSSAEVMGKLVDSGYRPTNEMMESYSYMSIFSNEELFIKALDWGFVPSLNFISRTNLLNNPNLVDRILDTIELTPEVISSQIFYGNAKAQQKIISERPDLLLGMNSSSTAYEQFWIEAFKQGYVPEEVLNNYAITGNLLLFSKVVKQHPEMVKYCKIVDKEQREQIDELALCMGYVPSLSDVQNSEYVKKSPKLMQALILRRPEAIKYIETRPLKGGYSWKVPQNEFFDLVRLSLDNGYIPTLKDIEDNPRLADSFDIMKILVQENPELINIIRDETPNKEELLKIAIENGFNGVIVKQYSGTEDDSYAFGGSRNVNELLYTETAIMYQLDKGQQLNNSIQYGNNYSINLYNYLISKGYLTKDIINLFNGNFETMKEIISKSPEYITILSKDLSRKEIDELGLLAIQGGYVPKIDDEIFGYGSETAKIMVRTYPEYLEKIRLMDSFGHFSAKPCEAYDEICKLSADAGFIPNVEEMGNGNGGSTTTRYNYSYDIMKKAIPLKPDLIESCSVADQEQYDELCRLAISYGYEATDEYALTHWASKMCSNYDIMARYITNHPNFLLNVEITNSEEMLKLIDIAINSGLELNRLNQNQLLQLFLSVDETKWRNYLDTNTIDSLQKAKTLYANNDEISKTVNPRFLSDEITSHFTKAQVEILSCYPKLQEKILKLSPNSFEAKIIYELVDKYKDNLEWIPILEKSLDNINSSEYANLLSSINDKELSSEEKENLMYLLMTNNHLDISSFDELKNIDSVREKYINTLIERNTLGSLKTAYFEKTFGIDLATAINLVNLYGKSLESSTIDSLDEKSRSEFILLENMKKIIGLNNLDVLKYYVENINPEFVVKPDLMVTYEARLKYLFTQEFNKSFTKPLQEDKVISNINGEQDLDIYLAAGRDGKKKCRMMITSIGAYTSMEEPDDYYASWNVDKIASHGCCCSYVGEKNLGTAEVKYCCLGFTDYDLGALQLSGPYDLCSASTEDSYQISSMYSSMYLLPDDILDYTRHTHNETVWERRSISGDAMFKKQPSYIVYFVDNFEDRLSEPEAMKQWESVKKAASNFYIEVDGVKKSLPIMVVERKKIAKSQLEIIQNKLNEFKTTLDSKLIKDIISDYESNYAGNREYHLNISEKYFPKHEQLSDSVVGEIIETIEKIYTTEPNIAIECIYELEKAVRNEQEKYNNTQHGVGQSLPSFNIEEALIDINKLKSTFKISMDSTLVMVNNSDGNERQFERSDISTIDQAILDTQLSSSEVISALTDSGLSTSLVMYENEIKEENVNGRLKVHGQRHIKNVLLYTTLIGQSVIQDKHDLNLIMLSAKYHDIGRKTDAYEEHAEASAKIAIEKLKDKCSSEDLSIISTIIEFHETPRNVANVDELFVAMARKNGITDDQIPRVRQMAEVLKDADALDRTRFINKARLNPEFLQYDVSKQLVKFASSLQETYAIYDLKEFHCDEAIGILLQTYTPQEVLRTIRHSTRGNLRNEDIQNFINSWASSSIQRTDELESMLSENGIGKGRC